MGTRPSGRVSSRRPGEWPGTYLMNTLHSLTLAALLAAPLAAQASNEEKRDEKISALKEDGWVTDYAEARARAAKEKKVIFVYFGRSYAP